MIREITQNIESLFQLNGSESKSMFLFKQLFLFAWLQSISCIFPVLIFLSLALSYFMNPGIPRYDLLLVICILAQWIMVKTRIETKDELLVITMFHILGLVMELHKVRLGSWSYPEEAYTKFGGVPLYAGFMYASVGSYICQAWRNLELSIVSWPKGILASLAGLAIYLNFFTNAFIPDLRLYITIILILVFYKTKFEFKLNGLRYVLPALVAFILIGFFIWIAENMATFFGAWKYAYQHAGWKMVTWHKITSWSLLVIVSIIIVGELKLLKLRRSSGR